MRLDNSPPTCSLCGPPLLRLLSDEYRCLVLSGLYWRHLRWWSSESLLKLYNCIACNIILLCRSRNTVYYTIAGTFNMPTPYQQWVWQREAHIDWSMVTCQGSTRSELPWGLLALCRRALGSERHRYAIAWQINSGLTRWCMAVLNK